MSETGGSSCGERDKLLTAIEALETQRTLLGNEVIETAIAPLRVKLQELEPEKTSAGKKLRRHATVLFADIIGFTSLMETLDPEEATEVLNLLWSLLDEVITRNGGTVDKHMGDAVMAMWGISSSREDDPERAVRAALEMQEVLHAFRLSSDEDAPLFRMRIGVHTGQVFISPVGSAGEYTAMGDTVNTANRLESSAPPDGVVISHAMYRRIRGLFALHPRNPVKVKGKSLPLRTYLVTGVNPRGLMQTNRGIDGIETPMVGRESDLSILMNVYERVMSERDSQLITIIGDAGVGKSRLLYEFRRLVRDRSHEPAILGARCTPGTETTPCSLFRDMLRLQFEILEDDPVDAVIRKLEQGMNATLSIDECHLAGHFAGFDLSSSEVVSKLEGSSSQSTLGRAALIKYLTETAHSDGTVLLLEDLHWADALSLDLVEQLASGRANGALFIIALARPILFEREPSWGQRPGSISVHLEPLSRNESTELIKELLGRIEGETDDILRLIADNAEGNPFHVEELIKMLIDDGIIVRGRETWSVSPDGLKAVSIPATLTGVLQARLDRLPEEEMVLLQKASVVGRIFWDLAVRNLSEDSGDKDLTSILNAVQARSLVYPSTDSAFSEAREYIFKHAVLRDVTYETVLLRLRRAYHGLVASWLEENAGDRVSEFTGLIAEHYERAKDTENALLWLTRAGKAAYTTSAYMEALSYFRRALDLLSDDSDPTSRADLLNRTGGSLEKLSRYDEAWEMLEQALELADEADSPMTAAEALIVLAWIATIRGMRKEAKDFSQLALSRAEESGDRSTMARALGRMADYEEDRTYEKLLSYYQRSIEMYRELADRNGMAISLLNMGNIAMDFREFEHARGYYKKSLEIYQEIGNRWGVANCLGNLGNVASAQKRSSEAMDLHNRSMALSISIGDVEGEVICNLNLGVDFSKLGRSDKSLEHSTRAMELAIRVGLTPLGLSGMSQIAERMESDGRYEDAAFIICFLLERGDQIPPEGLAELKEALVRVGDSLKEKDIDLDNIRASASNLTVEEAAARIQSRA